jgi:hypothetical protein
MSRPGFARTSIWVGAILLASSWAGVVHGQRAASGPSADAATIAALAQAPSGTWAVTGGRRTPVEHDAATVFAQADAYRRTDGGVLVPIAVGASVSEPCEILVRIGRAGAAPDSSRAAAEFSMAGGPGQVRETREVTLQPGTYEMSALLVRRGQGRAWVGTVARRPLVVPNLSATVFEASPVVIGEDVAVEREVATPRPFVFGATSLKPAATNRFHQADKLHLALRVYGWKGDTDAKPDLSVEYVFRQSFKNGLRFFNKTKPQALNAATLSKSFDGRGGALAAGISIPLEAFPPGEFQVVVRVKDKRTQATTEQTASFFVASNGGA